MKKYIFYILTTTLNSVVATKPNPILFRTHKPKETLHKTYKFKIENTLPHRDKNTAEIFFINAFSVDFQTISKSGDTRDKTFIAKIISEFEKNFDAQPFTPESFINKEENLLIVRQIIAYLFK